MKIEKIAIFVPTSIIEFSPSILNLVDFLSEKNIVYLFSNNEVRKSLFESSNVRYILINRGFLNYNDSFNLIFYSFKKMNFKLLAYRIYREINIWVNFIFNKMLNFKFIISFDPDMLILAKNTFPKNKHIYYSLELYLPSDNNVNEKWINYEYNSLKGIIIQSKIRADLFYKEFYVKNSINLFLLPVCYPFRLEKIQSPSKIKFPKQNYTIIYMGWYKIQFLKEIIDVTKDYKLSINIFFKNNDYAELTKYIFETNSNHVELSDGTKKKIEEIEDLLNRSDIGIVWYPNVDKNMYNTGYSSGKIATFLRYGIPIICNDYPTLFESIQKKGVGICVKEIKDINKAIAEILMNFTRYSEIALKEYNEIYSFRNYSRNLENYLNKI